MSLLTSLRHGVAFSTLLGTISNGALAAPAAKPAAPQAKPAAPASAAVPAKPAAPPAAKPATKPIAAPPKPAAVQPEPAAVSKQELAALRDENKALREDVNALREDLTRAVGTAATPSQARAKLEAELAEARQKRAAIQTAIDHGLDRTAVADSIKSTDVHIAELEAALAPRSSEPKGRSLAELAADVQRLEAVAAKSERGGAATAPALATAAPPAPSPKSDSAPAEVTVSKNGFFQPSATLQVWAFASHLATDKTPNVSWTNSMRIRRAELKIGRRG